MPTYIRNRAAGTSGFFTVQLEDHSSDLLVRHIDVVRAAYIEMARLRPVQCEAMVILPDHIHAVWTLPEGDMDFAARWGHFKAIISERLFPEAAYKATGAIRRRTGIWQRRYWEHMIQGPDDFVRHIEFCWFNPIQHELATRAMDWPYTTFHRDVRNGIVEADWGGALDDGRFGERSDLTQGSRSADLSDLIEEGQH